MEVDKAEGDTAEVPTVTRDSEVPQTDSLEQERLDSTYRARLIIEESMVYLRP